MHVYIFVGQLGWQTLIISVTYLNYLRPQLLILSGCLANHLFPILVQRIGVRSRRAESQTERRKLTFWLRCQQILFAVPKCLLCISPRTFEVTQDGYSVPTSAVRHRSSLDYTSDPATIHSQTSAINNGVAKKMKTASLGQICNVPNHTIGCMV